MTILLAREIPSTKFWESGCTLKFMAIDVGYRYMLNLKELNDRNGFVVKVGAGYWPEKAPPPANPIPLMVRLANNKYGSTWAQEMWFPSARVPLTRTMTF